MAFIPLGVLIIIIIGVLGGPAAFVRTVSNWGADMYSFAAGVIKNL